MNIVVAHTRDQALYFARNVKAWNDREWVWVRFNLERLRGIRDVTVWIVEAAGYQMTAQEQNYWLEAKYIIDAQKHRIKIETVLLS